ncbi:MAG: hypothetical protein ACE5G1_17285 [bacterium]
MVVVKIDMPATSDGVDVYPQKSQPIKYDEYGERLKRYGTALYPGDQVMVTKIKLKKKHIEFHLGGGGYGTLWDESDYVSTPYVEKSKREKNLEEAIKTATDAEEKEAMQEELDDLRREREKEQERLRMEAEQTKAAKQERIRQKALQAGSRFNIRYGKNLSAKEKTPESVMAALAKYVEFAPEGFVSSPVTSSGAPNSSKPQSLRKGLLWEDVAAMMGAPGGISERMEGNLKVISCTFTRDDQKIITEFVEGVLIKYTIMSK